MVLRASCGVIALLVALHVATDAKVFDLLRESNLPTWFSQAQFLAAGAVCAFVGLRDEYARTAWYLLAGVMTFFSLDEVAMIHERLEDRQGTELALLVVQPLAAVVIVAAIYRALRGRVVGRVLALLGVALGSLVLAQVSGAINHLAEPTGFVYDALAVIEEVGEMLTGTFVLVAAVTQSSKNA